MQYQKSSQLFFSVGYEVVKNATIILLRAIKLKAKFILKQPQNTNK